MLLLKKKREEKRREERRKGEGRKKKKRKGKERQGESKEIVQSIKYLLCKRDPANPCKRT